MNFLLVFSKRNFIKHLLEATLTEMKSCLLSRKFQFRCFFLFYLSLAVYIAISTDPLLPLYCDCFGFPSFFILIISLALSLCGEDFLIYYQIEIRGKTIIKIKKSNNISVICDV